MSCDQCCESLPLRLRQADITSEAALQFHVGLVFCVLHVVLPTDIRHLAIL